MQGFLTKFLQDFSGILCKIPPGFLSEISSGISSRQFFILEILPEILQKLLGIPPNVSTRIPSRTLSRIPSGIPSDEIPLETPSGILPGSASRIPNKSKTYS